MEGSVAVAATGSRARKRGTDGRVRAASPAAD